MGIFDVFKKKQSTLTASAIVEDRATFSVFGGDVYASDVFRSGVRAIASQVAKLQGAHYVQYSDQKRIGDAKLSRILSTRWNPYMSAYDGLYKLTTLLYIQGNAFAVLDRDGSGNVQGIYPVNYQSVEMLADGSGRMFVKFTFSNGKSSMFDYGDVIHLRRDFASNPLLGDDNEPIMPIVELSHVQNESVIKGLKSGASIRGLLKTTGILSDDKLKAYRDSFVKDYLSMSNDGGVVMTDSNMEYTPLDSKPVLLDSRQTEAIQAKVFAYLGVSKEFVNNSYTEDTMSAVIEGVVEPIAIQLSEEFTHKVFTEREVAFGNSIVFDAGRMIFSSNATKIKMISTMMPYGLLTINEARTVMNLPPVEDGDKRVVTLNVVSADQQDDYQAKKAEGSA